MSDEILRTQVEVIEQTLSYIPIGKEQAKSIHLIRQEAKKLAYLVVQIAPSCTELEIGMNDLRTALLWWDEAIKRHVRNDL